MTERQRVVFMVLMIGVYVVTQSITTKVAGDATLFIRIFGLICLALGLWVRFREFMTKD